MYRLLVGNDARKAVADGYPVTKVIASDLEPGKQGTQLPTTVLTATCSLLEARASPFQVNSGILPSPVYSRRRIRPCLSRTSTTYSFSPKHATARFIASHNTH